MNGRRAGFQQDLGAFADRCAGGQHVVDKNEALAAHNDGFFYSKRASDIELPFLAPQMALGLGLLVAHQKIDDGRLADLPTYRLRQQRGLIIAAF